MSKKHDAQKEPEVFDLLDEMSNIIQTVYAHDKKLAASLLLATVPNLVTEPDFDRVLTIVDGAGNNPEYKPMSQIVKSVLDNMRKINSAYPELAEYTQLGIGEYITRYSEVFTAEDRLN